MQEDYSHLKYSSFNATAEHFFTLNCYKKGKSSKSLAIPVMEKLAMETHRKEGKVVRVAGTLLFIVQYFTESTKASSVLTRIVL